MKFRSALFVLSLAALLVGGALVTTGAASAHERRAVKQYTFVVGWLNEPAYLNQPNAIDLRISKTEDSSPVEGLEKTLKAEVTADGKKVNVELKPRFRTPGAYDGRLLPTKEGSYAFKFTGTIEGVQIDETFTAGPGTFGLVESPLAFPNALPSLTGVDETVKGFDQRVVSLEADDASSKANTAMAVGIAGIVIGAVGLVVGGYGLTRKPGN
ncbi:MAG TPA: hypothetical protein VJB57_12740 [Dehalococcoidia bacterium]|nr:hypothetical protein [Dehalococcoidia bacterium]